MIGNTKAPFGFFETKGLNSRKSLLLIALCFFLPLRMLAQFQLPAISQTYYPPIPVVGSDLLNSADTKYISNYSTDFAPWSFAAGKGADIVGWSLNETIGGGKIMVGNHVLSPASQPFIMDDLIDVPDAVDIRVGYMGDFVVAAYYNLALQQYEFSAWAWGGPGTTISPTPSTTFVLPTVSGAPVLNYQRISMDVNYDGTRAAIVYSDGGTIYGSGITRSGAVFTVSTPTGTPYLLSSLIGPASQNENPDVSFSRDMGTGNDYVFYTYYNPAVLSGSEAVFSMDWTDFNARALLPPSLLFLNSTTLPAGTNYVNFDCPDQFSYQHWAYTYSDGNKIYITADTANGGSPSVYTTVVNDGTLTRLSYDLSAYPNVAPRLTYKHYLTSDQVFIVWASGAPAGVGSTGYTDTYIGALVELNGASAPNSITTDYAIIEDVSTATYVSSLPLIAIARNARNANRFVSFGTDEPIAGYELKHKNVEFFNDFYRFGFEDTNAISGDLYFYPNPFTNQLKLQLSGNLAKESWNIRIGDMLGRTLSTYQGNHPEMFIASRSQMLGAGQYFIYFNSENTIPKVVKVVKQ